MVRIYAPDEFCLEEFIKQYPEEKIKEAFTTLYEHTYIKTASGKCFRCLIYSALSYRGAVAKVSIRRISPSQYERVKKSLRLYESNWKTINI